MFRKAALVCALSLPLLTAAEEPSSPPAIAKAPDFSEAFQRLEALGLPPIKDAEWIAGNPNSVSGEDYQLREIIGELQGNGWKIKVDGKDRFLGFGSLDTTEVPKGEGGQSRGLLGSLFGGGSSKPKGADLRKDAKHLSDLLNDPAKSEGFREGIEYSGKSSAGRLLIFAAQLHQTGHSEEANRLAATVFSLGLAPEVVIDSAVNRLATREYSLVLAGFKARQDWSAYHRDLQHLTTRYPRGWEAYGAVQILIPAVANRAANVPPPKPVLEGVTLNPEAVAALEEIFSSKSEVADEDAIQNFIAVQGISPASVTPKMRERIIASMEANPHDYDSGLWLIQDHQAFQGNSPNARLKRLGVEALPVLAAFAKDQTLVDRMNSNPSHGIYISRSDSTEEKLLKAYQQLPRPQSRGEVACRFLASTLPKEQDHTSIPAETLAESAVSFWKANRGKSRLELIQEFITSGSSNQKSRSMAMLSGMPEQPARQAFEKYATQEGNALSSGEAVRNYLKIHRGSAKAFFAAYSTALKAELENEDATKGGNDYQIRQAGGVDSYLRKLSLLLGAESPQKLLIEIAKADKPAPRQIRVILETLEQRPREEIITMVLDAILVARSPETRMAFFEALNLAELPLKEKSGGEEAGAATEHSVPSSSIEKWTTLLADDRAVKNWTTVGLGTAMTLENLYSPSGDGNLRDIAILDYSSYREIVLARARERVTGKPLTPVPDGDNVTAEQVLKLLEPLASEKPEVVSSRMEAWPIQDKLGYLTRKHEEGVSGKIPESVLAAQRVILPVKELGAPIPPTRMNEILQAVDLPSGTLFSGDTLIAIAAKLAPQIKGQSGLKIDLPLTTLGNGRHPQAIRVFEMKKDELRRIDYYILSQTAVALEDKSGIVLLMWTVPDGESTDTAVWSLTDSGVEAPSPEKLEKLRREIIQPSDSNDRESTITLSVFHRDDLEKLQSLSPSSSSESDPFVSEQE